MFLVIDNYDSFTYNLVQYLGELSVEYEITRELIVKRNDEITLEEIIKLNHSGILLSPGPGNPDQSGICLPILKKLSKNIPTLGVCLGHQALAQAFGGKVIVGKELMHGKTSKIFHNQKGLFEDIALTNESLIKKEIWINTSEAEILPALNPSYEISKSLIGKLVSFKKNLMDKNIKKKFIIKKIILGPFKSELNPIGIMSPKFVSKKIYNLANSKNYLIIISPNPLTYLLFPIKEFFNFLYLV